MHARARTYTPPPPPACLIARYTLHTLSRHQQRLQAGAWTTAPTSTQKAALMTAPYHMPTLSSYAQTVSV